MKELFLRNKTRVGLFVLGVYLTSLTDPGVREFLSSHDVINSIMNMINGGLITAGIIKSDQFYRDKKALKEAAEDIKL